MYTRRTSAVAGRCRGLVRIKDEARSDAVT
jgi:hypothetical protein